MRLDQGEELHPELRPELRSAEGQRLNAARAEFRAEWQAKVDRKRQQAAWSLRVANALDVWAVVPAVYGMVALLSNVGVLNASAPMAIVLLVAWGVRRRAEHLERELQEMGFSETAK